MICQLLVLMMSLANGSPNSNIVEENGIQVRTTIQASQYSWEVTNLNSEPITSFRIEPHLSYNFKAPKGWTLEQETGNLFLAQASLPEYWLLPGNKITFSKRVTSAGAVLGQRTATIGLANDEIVKLEGVWCSRPEWAFRILTIPVLIVLIVAIHLLIIRKRIKDDRQ